MKVQMKKKMDNDIEAGNLQGFLGLILRRLHEPDTLDQGITGLWYQNAMSGSYYRQ